MGEGDREMEPITHRKAGGASVGCLPPTCSLKAEVSQRNWRIGGILQGAIKERDEAGILNGSHSLHSTWYKRGNKAVRANAILRCGGSMPM